MRILSILLTLIFSASAHADTVSGMFGFNRGEVNFGGQYEHEFDNGLGLGGFFHLAGDDEDNNIPEVMSIAGNLKVHFNPVSDKVGVYVAPGFGIHMYELGQTDETFMGPSLQWGVLFHVSNKASIGVENLNIYNWLEEDVASRVEYLNMIFSFSI